MVHLGSQQGALADTAADTPALAADTVAGPWGQEVAVQVPGLLAADLMLLLTYPVHLVGQQLNPAVQVDCLDHQLGTQHQ